MLVSAVSALIIAGCSVKENRDGCPCRLMLDFSEVDTSVIRSANLLVTAQDGVVFADEATLPVSGGLVQTEVPRTDLRINVYSGASENTVADEGIMIPLGEQASPLYMHSSEVDSRRESLYEKIMMRKEHCVLTVLINDEERFPFTIKLTGNVCGYDVYGLPVRGDFLCDVEGNAKNGFSAIVPRQLDSSLQLKICDGSKVTETFAVGEYLESSGYDWTKEDLEDVTVRLDYCLTYVVLTVSGWNEEFTYKVEI